MIGLYVKEEDGIRAWNEERGGGEVDKRQIQQFLFFQAEDGIRDAQGSRGLGTSA